MSRSPITNWLALALVTGASLAACVSSLADDPAFEQLRDATHRVSNGHELYLVSGDVAVSESELRDMYDQVYSHGTGTVRQDSIVNRVGRQRAVDPVDHGAGRDRRVRAIGAP